MKKNLSVSAIALFLMFMLMRWQGGSLKTVNSPRAIVDLEFANTPQKLHDLLIGWEISVVKMNVWLDFLFIVAYVTFLSVAAEFCAMKWPVGMGRKAGLWLARLAYLAGVLDIAENLLMLQSVAGHFNPASLQLTYYCAVTKFSLAALVISYLLISLPFAIRKNK
ncbi:MAG: hypothetical protein M0Q26_07065 [Chitinophagaceae bacterium]|nr:hypothetical protein [Chitinophagaceae bacterium]